MDGRVYETAWNGWVYEIVTHHVNVDFVKTAVHFEIG